MEVAVENPHSGTFSNTATNIKFYEIEPKRLLQKVNNALHEQNYTIP